MGSVSGEPTLEAVLQALRVLYHSPDTSEKERASTWLEEYQKSIYAWTISDQLLSHKGDLESCYFAAQTMRTKIQHQFYELPPETHTSLKDSLLNHIATCDHNTSAVVVTQLSLALADLALLMATWKNAVPDLLTKFAPNPNSYPVLLEVLTVIPEEISSRHLRLGKNRRAELTVQFSEAFEGVHQFLLACLGTYHTDQQFCVKLLKCLSSWFSVGAVPDDSIRQSPLLEAIFHFLADLNCQSQLHEAASDCLISALVKCEDMNRYGHLAQVLFERILTLHSVYQTCANQGDTDRCLNFARIFTEMSESFTEAIVQFPNRGMGNFSQLELICSTLENDAYEVAEICFNFWYNLSEHLYQVDSKDLNQQFSPYIQRVILSLSKHVKLDADHEGVLETSDDFYDFRCRARDLIKDTVFIVSSTKIFREMASQLKPDLSWDTTESYLFVMAAIANNLEPREDTVVPHVLNAILCEYCNPPTKLHIALSYTCVTMIGELGEWVKHHADVLDAVLQFLLLCLRESRLCNVAASALDQICDQCQAEQRMIQNFPTILQIVKDVDSFQIKSDATVKLIKAAAVILSGFPDEQLSEGIRELCSYQVIPLKQLVEGTEAPTKKHRSSRTDPGFWIDRLTSVVRYGIPKSKSNGHHPCYQVISDLWSTFSDVCMKYQSDAKIIEKCCRCIRFAIRHLGTSFTPLLSPLVTLMVTLYTQHLHSCYLYLGSILVDEFAKQPNCIQGLLEMTQALAMPTFESLSKPNALTNNTDVVDDFFRLCLRFLQQDRLVLLDSQIAVPMFKCAIASSTLMHREANSSVMRFLTELLNVKSPPQGKEMTAEDTAVYKQVQSLLQQEGQLLVETLLECCVTALPSSMMLDVGDVFQYLVLFDKEATSRWLELSLQKLPTQSAGGVITATQQQLKDFHTGIISASDSRDITPILKEFLILYR